MLLKNYKRIVEIDTTILDLHAQLASLYNERSSIVIDTPVQQTSTGITPESTHQSSGTTIENEWELAEYNRLKQVWAKCDIKIPAYSKLQTKLAKAQTIITDLQTQLTDNTFSVQLVPPTTIFNTLLATKTFEHRNINFASTVDMNNEPKRRSWKVTLVASNPIAVSGDSLRLMTENEQRIAGYQMPGMSPQEYAIYLLINNSEWIIDENSWSLLPRSINAINGDIVCTAFVCGSYQFDMDSMNVLVGNNHFRPAMEIV